MTALCLFFAVVKVGILGLDTSHVLHFTKEVNVLKSDPVFEGFRITHGYRWGSKDIVSCTNRWEKYEPQLKANGLTVVGSVREVLDNVDVVLLETNDGREHYEQALEVFKAGKPCFIDKPLAHNLADAIRIVEAAKKYNAKFFSCSGLRFAPGAAAARRGELGVIRGADVYSAEDIEPHHSYYYWYAIHAGEPLLTIMGPGVLTASATSTETEDVVVGTWPDGRLGVMRSMNFKRKGCAGGGVIFTETKGVVEMGRNKGYLPLLREIFKFFRTGVAPVSPDETLEILAFLEAGARSRALGGVAVSVPETLEAARREVSVAARREVSETTLTLVPGKAVDEKVWNFPVEQGKAVTFTVEAEYCAADGRPPFNDLHTIASWVDARAGRRHANCGLGAWTDPTERDPGASWKYWQRDYLRHADRMENGVTVRTFSDTINVPTNVVSVDVECFVKARPATVKIRSVTAEIVAALPKRVARIVLANPRRGGPSTIAARDAQIVKALDEVFATVAHPDFVMACSEVFPESVNRDPAEQREPVPEGPTSRILIRYAKKYRCYVAGGIKELCKDGIVRNGVALFDREGKLVGTYHKVHLTTGEFLEGMSAGNAFKVFDTDFGRIAFCICWDNFFPEDMRMLQLNGAELVIFPIAATNEDRFEHVFRTRSIDTGLPLAVQIRQGPLPNRILGRRGETLAESSVEYKPCWADIDLADRARCWWLSVGAAYGDPYELHDAERRPELYR